MKQRMRNGLVAFCLLCAASSAQAAEGHTLFDPTPDDQLRPMAADRPSKSDGPYSLDAGRFQLESSLVSTVYNDDCAGGTCTRTRTNGAGGSTTLRVGLTDTAELQITSDLYQHSVAKDRTAGTKTTSEGFGDTQLRLKMNLMGNDPASFFAIGVIPSIKIPTNQDNLGNNEYEGGVSIPLNFNTAGGWSLGGMTQFNLVSEPDNSGYDMQYVNSIIAARNVTDSLNLYGEFYTSRTDQSSADWENTVDFGAVYAVSENMSLDANVAFGVTDAADDTTLFAGAAYRF